MPELSQAITIANNALNERGKYPWSEQSVGEYWVGKLEQLEAEVERLTRELALWKGSAKTYDTVGEMLADMEADA